MPFNSRSTGGVFNDVDDVKDDMNGRVKGGPAGGVRVRAHHAPDLRPAQILVDPRRRAVARAIASPPLHCTTFHPTA